MYNLGVCRIYFNLEFSHKKISLDQMKMNGKGNLGYMD